MKKLQKISSLIRGVAVGLAVIGCIGTAKAIPFASSATNIILNSSNYVTFILNESGTAISTVTYPSGTSNVLTTNGLLGRYNFPLGTDTSYAIYCYKAAGGAPFQISVDALATTNYTTATTNWFIGNLFPTPRGIDIIKNPTIGSQFGRIFVGNDAPGTIQTTSGTTETGATVPGSIVIARGQGLYAMNADSSDALGFGTNAQFTSSFTATSTGSSPYRISVNPNDNTVDVTDFASVNATYFKFDPNFATSNSVYGTNHVVISPIGEPQGIAAGTHGDGQASFSTGSIATSNLEYFTWDTGLPAPSTNCVFGIGNEGQTTAGGFNNVFRYDIGAGPLPWPHGPNSAVNISLPTFQDTVTGGTMSLGPDLGANFIYAGCDRGNLSDPCVQVFTNVPTTTNIVGTNIIVTPGYYSIVWSSMTNAQGQMVTAGGVADSMVSSYGGVRVSPDGRYLASINIDNNIALINLTNGVPDNTSLIFIGGNTTSSARGLAFDAADNIYFCSSGLALVRGYSPGFTATTVYSNDVTGLNGSFVLVPPPTTATVFATQNASQNYINSTPPGTPIPGIFQIRLTTNSNASPVSVSITLGGTGTNGVNYTLNSADANGVTYSATKIVFPAGTNAGGTNWVANLLVTPTASPLIGPSFSVTLSMVGGTNYGIGSPSSAQLSIANTGPQYLFLSAASSLQGPTMNRGIPNDYARFIVTRWGDTNGPGNSSTLTNQVTYTVTNITYGGTAHYTNDYGALAQRLDPAGNGFNHIPVAGAPGIVIYPGNVTINCDLGLPVFHTNANLPGTNLTITVNLETATNTVGGTNGVSVEGYSYDVGTTTLTLNEIDNAKLAEVVIWGDPLTNSVDPGWTLTYDSTNMNYGGTTFTYTNPVVVANYTNGETALYGGGGGSNDFRADFGYVIGNESATTFGELPNVPQSPQMANNGWTNALRMTANKDGNFAPAAVNLFPTNVFAAGNYALRFEMYLSTYYYAQGNPNAGSVGREFSLFGINSYGTNCNWRPTFGVNAGTGGNGPTNTDGVYVGIDAGSGSLTPADFDAFNSPALPNSGNLSVTTTIDTDITSNPNSGDSGIFKNPPFILDMSTNGGAPANIWVEVSLEQSQIVTNFGVFNLNLYLEHNYVTPALTQWTTAQGGLNGMVAANYVSGVPMLGYEDPVNDVSDESAFVYYSNVRLVELSPYISVMPTNMLVLKGSLVTNTATAIYSYGGVITNTWFRGTTAPATVVQVDTNASTNFTDILVVNTQTGSNYWAEFTDSSGGTTVSAPVSVEVVTPPANVSAGVGGTATFSVSGTGPTPLATYAWKTNGVTLVTSTKYKVINAASLTNSSVQLADSGVSYSCTVTCTATNDLTVAYTETLTTSGGILTVETAPSGAVVSPAAQTNVWGSSASFTVTVGAGSPTLVYAWTKNGTKLVGATKYSGTNATTLVISNLTQADDSTNYAVIVTNLSGSTTSTMGSLVVYVPQPTFTGASPGGTTFAFTSTNVYDTSNAFILLSSPTAIGPYTNAVGATFSGSAGSFSVTIPQPNSSNMFYQLQHVN